jgi:hypothetical protein
MSITHYYKNKLVNENIEVEYDSEKDEITVVIHHKLNNGGALDNSIMWIHPSYVEPLTDLLRAVKEPVQPPPPTNHI